MSFLHLRIIGIFILLSACNQQVSSSNNTSQQQENMSEQSLEFTLSHSFKERSRDSHGLGEYFTVKNQKIAKTNTFSGKVRKPKEVQQVKISKKQKAQLSDFIQKLGLAQNYKKEYPVATSGVVRTYHSKFNMADYSIDISGGVEQRKDEVALKVMRLKNMLDLLIKGEEALFEKNYIDMMK